MPSRPFNILYLSSFGSAGRGGQESLFLLVKNLDMSLFRPHVVLPCKGTLGDKLIDQNTPISFLEFPKMAIKNIPKILIGTAKLYKLTQDYKIDIIHTDGPRNTFYAGLIAKLKRIPLIWHIRASNKDRYDRFLYHLSSKLVLVANSLRSRFDWVEGSHKFVTIYNGVDLSEFQTKKPITPVRQEYGIGDKVLLISVVARVERLKGQKYLIEACGRLKSKLKDFYILLVGEIVDLSYLRECKDRSKEFEIQDRIIFAGQQNRVVQILNETDIFVLPSLFEAFPRSLIEAMGVGRPVVTTEVGGCLEAVEDFVSGFLVPPRDPKALADRIYMLAVDNELRLKVGSAARVRAEKMFSIQQNVKETQKLYREILGENPGDINGSEL